MTISGSIAVSYNANNQQTTFAADTLTYDLNGNLVTVTDGSDTTTYTWNVRNQLTSISGPSFAASFTYDSFGRRTGRTVQSVTTNFVYDGLNPVQEKDGSTVTTNLLTGLNLDEFFTRTDGAGVRSLLPDALDSTVALGDNTGALQTQYTYEPFGFTTQTGAASTNSYKYTGREDDGNGMYYYRARYYHPRLQRFISEDPIGFKAGDFNIYAYTGNSATKFRDPLGLFTIGDFFDSDLTVQGLAAFADGMIPFWDPLAANGLYNPCDSRLAYNKTIGILTRDLELGLTIGASSGALFGRGGLLNQGPWRVGWGQKKGVGQVFRVGGPGKGLHLLDWPPITASAIGYGSMAGAGLADLFMNGGQSCGCQQ